MKFISGSHKDGFYERIVSTKEGNVLNDNGDMIIPENWRDKTYQSILRPGQCTFHDGNYGNTGCGNSNGGTKIFLILYLPFENSTTRIFINGNLRNRCFYSC